MSLREVVRRASKTPLFFVTVRDIGGGEIGKTFDVSFPAATPSTLTAIINFDSSHHQLAYISANKTNNMSSECRKHPVLPPSIAQLCRSWTPVSLVHSANAISKTCNMFAFFSAILGTILVDEIFLSAQTPRVRSVLWPWRQMSLVFTRRVRNRPALRHSEGPGSSYCGAI